MTTRENIKAILECNFSGFRDEYIEFATNKIMEIIDKRQPGKWITDINPYLVFCNNCMRSNGNRQDNFCPCCGAYMRGDNNVS